MTSLWTITGCQVTTGMQVTPTATVKMMGLDGVELCVAATGTGPVDAMYKAIDQIVGVKDVLKEYSLQGVTEGIEALATTWAVIEFKQVAERKKGGLEDEELEAIVVDSNEGSPVASLMTSLWTVTGCQVTTGMQVTPTATVKMMGPGWR